MAKSKTGTYVGIGIAVVAIVALVFGAIVLNNSRNQEQNNDNGGGTETSKTDTTTSTTELTDADLQQVNEAIPFGDYEEMEVLSKKIQNGELVGKVVHIDGLVSHPGTMYSIVQENAAGSQKIGTRFIIEGLDEDEYPEDGDRVTITGKVVELEPMVYVIKTMPGYVVVDEGATIIDDAEE